MHGRHTHNRVVSLCFSYSNDVPAISILLQNGLICLAHLVVPAQYFRNQAKIEEYLSHSSFLRDINNERWNDTQPISGAEKPSGVLNEEGDTSPRNESYKAALTGLNNLVLLAFE